MADRRRPAPLIAYPKPDAQGASSKVSFAVLYSPVDRPGFGQERSVEALAWPTALGWLTTFSGDNQTTAQDPKQTPKSLTLASPMCTVEFQAC